MYIYMYIIYIYIYRRLWNSVHEAEEAVDVTHQSPDHDVDKEGDIL